MDFSALFNSGPVGVVLVVVIALLTIIGYVFRAYKIGMDEIEKVRKAGEEKNEALLTRLRSVELDLAKNYAPTVHVEAMVNRLDASVNRLADRMDKFSIEFPETLIRLLKNSS